MKLAHIFALLFAIAFMVAGFKFLKHGRKIAFSLFCFSFLCVLLGCFQSIQIGFGTEQILCWVAGLSLFILSVYLFTDKDKFSLGLVVLFLAVGAAFCGLSSVQAFLKTGMLLRVLESLDDYGKKLDAYQTNVVSMEVELKGKQSSLSVGVNLFL